MLGKKRNRYKSIKSLKKITRWNKTGVFCALLISTMVNYASEAPKNSVDVLPEFLKGISLIGNSQINGIHGIHIEGSTVELNLKTDEGTRWWVRITVSSSIEEGRKEFAKVMCPAAPSRLPFSFGDERRVWGSKGSIGGTVAIRSGIVVITVSGDLEFNKLLKIAGSIDEKVLGTGPDVIKNEILTLNAAETAKKIVASSVDQAATRKKVAKIVADLSGNAKSDERQKLISQLVILGDLNAIPVIIANLDPKYDIVTRERAAQALGELRDKRGILPLMTILEQPIKGKNLDDGGPEENLRRQAVTSLEKFGDSSVIPFLERIESNDKEFTSVREAARTADERLKEKNE